MNIKVGARILYKVDQHSQSKYQKAMEALLLTCATLVVLKWFAGKRQLLYTEQQRWWQQLQQHSREVRARVLFSFPPFLRLLRSIQGWLPSVNNAAFEQRLRDIRSTPHAKTRVQTL